jgi:CBS domain-containing protein
MRLVRHVMASEVKTVKPEMNACDAAGVMASYDVGMVPVVDDDDRLVGVVTDRDLVVRVLAARQDPMRTPVGDVVTGRELVTISPDAQVSEARELMSSHRIRRLPVVKADRLVGVVSLGDVAVADPSKRAVGETLEVISESAATTDVRSDGPNPGTPGRVMEARARDA